MVLTMKSACEKCETGLAPGGEAFICSFECTFCPACAVELNYRCSNCGGELVARPRRRADPGSPHVA